MPAKLDDILPAIRAAGPAGLTMSAITAKFAAKGAPKDRAAPVREKLNRLVRDGAVRGPFKHGVAQYYFAAGHGPSVDTASQAIIDLVSRSGVKLLSKPGLEKKVTGMNKRFFADGLKHATATQAIAELSCGSSKYYLHRDVAADYFGFEVDASDEATPAPERQTLDGDVGPATSLTLDDLLPAYRRLKAEQGGFSTVKIFDLLQALNRPKEDLHNLLLAETKAGRVTIHPISTVDLPREEIEAGIRLPGFAEPFVTVVVTNDP
ncbi:MAG: hypothetical protein V7634_495 [Bradyrhizobium sp.]|jgi:hypothetical protein